MEMNKTVKIAGIQMTPVILEKEYNLKRCCELLSMAAEQGSQLIVFPECCLTGYIYSSLDEAIPVAETIPGPSTDELGAMCRRLNVYSIIGLIEEDEGKFYNAVTLIGPDGLLGKYRKLHLPYLGIDRFLNHGDLPLCAYETGIAKIGMGICYDARFPEHARSLTLQGAEIIAYPTNLADFTTFKGDHVILTRAYENLVFCISVNRTGEERGIRFTGGSKIVDFSSGGTVLAKGKLYEEDIIYAGIEPDKARDKHCVIAPGEFEIDILKDRRPDYYGALIQSLSDTSRIR
jgi:predicted amidohydrolase